ncbi:MAG: hypothetical protein JW857_09530 [Bacteroidales bacterium]|nr:hypothetical protein [Bacteroidales bacterium]
MKHNRFIIHVGISLLLIIGLSAKAQTVTEEQVTVIAPYNPRVSKAQKIDDIPAIEEQHVRKLKLLYSTNPQLMNTPFYVEELKAAPYQSLSASSKKQNYLIAGMGLYTTPYAELFLNTKLKRNYTIGAHGSYLSSNISLADYAYSGFSENNIELWAKKTETDFSGEIGAFYQRDRFHYYGFKPNDIPTGTFSTTPDFKEISEQVFSDIGFKFNAKSTTNSTRDGLRLKGSYRYFWDKYKNSEHSVDVDAHFKKPISFLGIQDQYANIKLLSSLVVTNWEKETQISNASLLGLSPKAPQQFFHGKTELALNYSIHSDRIKFKAGAVLAAGLDSTSTINIYPDFLLDINIVPRIVDLYVRYGGELISPSYYSLTRENPYVSAFLPLEYSSSTQHIKAGIKANIVDRVDLILWGSTEHINNALFFTSDTSGVLKNQFNLIYDDVDLIKVGGEIKFSVENILLGMQVLYQQYTMTTETEAWYKPDWSMQLDGAYWLFDNLKMSAVLKTQSKVWAKEGVLKHELDKWVQLDVGADYHFNKELSVFARLNTIFSKNKQMWYNYPVNDFGAMLGASYRF